MELAGRSAELGRPEDGLADAVVQCVLTAGWAHIPHLAPGIRPGPEPSPPDEVSARIAACVAKTAENAAAAAVASPPLSPEVAQLAFRWAESAIEVVGDPDRINLLESDFAALHRVSKHGQWDDSTTVPMNIFEILDRGDSVDRPWWRPW